MALVRALAEPIALPPSEVMVSPWARPAVWAGPLVTTPATAAPATEDPVFPELPPKTLPNRRYCRPSCCPRG